MPRRKELPKAGSFLVHYKSAGAALFRPQDSNRRAAVFRPDILRGAFGEGALLAETDSLNAVTAHPPGYQEFFYDMRPLAPEASVVGFGSSPVAVSLDLKPKALLVCQLRRELYQLALSTLREVTAIVSEENGEIFGQGHSLGAPERYVFADGGKDSEGVFFLPVDDQGSAVYRRKKKERDENQI